jgi:plasmid stability protein
MTVIDLPDEQAAALKANAAAEGLSLEAWLQKLAEQERPDDRPRRHIADVILENMQDVPPEIMATMPEDGASQHDHHIYGWPKKEASPRFSPTRSIGSP